MTTMQLRARRRRRARRLRLPDVLADEQAERDAVELDDRARSCPGLK